MVSPILEGIVVTCHINRAVLKRHLITKDAGGGAAEVSLLSILSGLSILSSLLSTISWESNSTFVFVFTVVVVAIGTLFFGVSFIFWFTSHCFGHFLSLLHVCNNVRVYKIYEYTKSLSRNLPSRPYHPNGSGTQPNDPTLTVHIDQMRPLPGRDGARALCDCRLRLHIII